MLLSRVWKVQVTYKILVHHNRDCAGAYCQPSLPKPYPHDRHPYKSKDGRIFVHAAASDSILFGAGCDTCFELTRTDMPQLPKVIIFQFSCSWDIKWLGFILNNSHQVVVHVDNYCPCQYNSACCKDHFDIAAPGFDYSTSSVYSNVCAQTDPAITIVNGHQACMYGSPSQCDCNTVSTDPALVEGCNVFKSMQCDNCVYNYVQITCPF